jgi:minor fimbrial subunit
MKKIIAFLALGLIAQAHAEDIQIQMTGNIYANTCIIDSASREPDGGFRSGGIR